MNATVLLSREEIDQLLEAIDGQCQFFRQCISWQTPNTSIADGYEADIIILVCAAGKLREAKADPSCHYPSTIGALTHRPREARKFASREEAEAAIPDLQPWIDRYVADWQARGKEEKSFTATPLRPFFERELLAIYPDGSGLAREEMRRGMERIAEFEEKARTLRRFIQKHEETLAGMAWSVSFWGDSEIQLGARAYRRVYCQPEDIAALWPVTWKRRREKYPDAERIVYDWVSKLDDVVLVLERAEVIKLAPVDRGEDGTVVKLRKAVAA